VRPMHFEGLRVSMPREQRGMQGVVMHCNESLRPHASARSCMGHKTLRTQVRESVCASWSSTSGRAHLERGEGCKEGGARVLAAAADRRDLAGLPLGLVACARRAPASRLPRRRGAASTAASGGRGAARPSLHVLLSACASACSSKAIMQSRSAGRGRRAPARRPHR